MSKRTVMTVAVTLIQKIIEAKIRTEFQNVNKTLLSYLARTYKASYAKTKRSYYLIVILECTSWIVQAMVNILVNQRKTY